MDRTARLIDGMRLCVMTKSPQGECPTGDYESAGTEAERQSGKSPAPIPCEHKHTLPPSRWSPKTFCIDCGKDLP